MRIFYSFLFVLLTLISNSSFATFPKNSSRNDQRLVGTILNLRTISASQPRSEHWGILHVQLTPNHTSAEAEQNEQGVKDVIATALQGAIKMYSPKGFFECNVSGCGCQQFTSENFKECECDHGRNQHQDRLFPTQFHVYYDPTGGDYHLWISIVGRTDDWLKFINSDFLPLLSHQVMRITTRGWVTEEPNEQVLAALQGKPHLLQLARFLHACFTTNGLGDPNGLLDNSESEAEDESKEDESKEQEDMTNTGLKEDYSSKFQNVYADNQRLDDPDPEYLRYLHPQRFLEFAKEAKEAIKRGGPIDIPEHVFVSEEEFKDPDSLWEHVVVSGTVDDSDALFSSQIDQLREALETHKYFSRAKEQHIHFAIGWRRFSIRPGSDEKKALRAWGRLSWTSPVIKLNVQSRERPADKSAMDFLDLTLSVINYQFGSGKVYMPPRLLTSPRLFGHQDFPLSLSLFPNEFGSAFRTVNKKDFKVIIKLNKALYERAISETIAAIEEWSDRLTSKPALYEGEHQAILELFYDILTDICTGKTTFSVRQSDKENLAAATPAPGSLISVNLHNWINSKHASVQGADGRDYDEESLKSILLGGDHLESEGEDLLVYVPFHYPVDLEEVDIWSNAGPNDPEAPKKISLYADVAPDDFDEAEPLKEFELAKDYDRATLSLKSARSFRGISSILLRLSGNGKPFFITSLKFIGRTEKVGFDATYIGKTRLDVSKETPQIRFD